MKKIILIMSIISVLVVSIVAFTSAQSAPDTGSTPDTAQTEPTQAPTTTPTVAPTQAPTVAPTQAPTQAPTEPPTEAPTNPPVEVPEPVQIYEQPVTDWDSFLNGNVWDPSNVAYDGPRYNLTEQELHQLGWVCYREQGSLEGARMEASLMANLYEHSGGFSSVHDYVMNSGWFGPANTGDVPENPDSGDFYAVVKDVLVDGHRYLPSDVVEHDCLSDIASISTGDVYNKDDYIPFVTVINNVYGSTYTFIGFAPNGGDPFGFI